MAKAVFERSNPPLYRVYDGERLVMKRCSKCHEHKTIENYTTDPARKDGLQHQCVRCKRALHKIRAAKRKLGKRCVDCGASSGGKRICTKCTAKINDRRVVEREALKQRTDNEILDAQRKLRPTGLKRCAGCRTELSLDQFGVYRREPDGLHTRCIRCAYLAKLKVNAYSLLARWEELGLYACVYCDAPYEDIEHTIPRAQGGTDHIENLVPACQECNRGPGGKFARTPAEWRPEQHAEMRATIGRLRQMQD